MTETSPELDRATVVSGVVLALPPLLALLAGLFPTHVPVPFIEMPDSGGIRPIMLVLAALAGLVAVPATARAQEVPLVPLEHFFDNLVIPASNSLPRTYTQKLEPWDLDNLEPYGEAYLSGFRSERYSVGLEQGWSYAQDIIDTEIDQRIRRQIGGDEQRITWKDTHYGDVTFKHILLPVWISAYRYNGEVYRFLVNARTGEVQGERPWSWIKITLAVLAALIILALFWYLGGG